MPGMATAKNNAPGSTPAAGSGTGSGSGSAGGPSGGSSLSADDRIVILHGKEAFLRTEWLRRLQVALRERHGELDEYRYPGTTPMAIVLDEVRSFGLLAGHKIVIVDEADQFLQGEDRRRAMERYAADPCEGATLVLRSEIWRPGNLDKLVAKVGRLIKCDLASVPEATRWVTGRCERRHAARIDPAAAELLVERMGTELARLDSELAKLAIAANTAAGLKEGAVINRTLVVQLVGLGREEQAWSIQEPILAGDAAAAVRMVGELLEVSRAPEVMISWSLVDVARKLAEAGDRFASGESDREVASALRLWGPSASAVLGAARRRPVGNLRSLFAMALEGDRALKSGGARDPRRHLEGLASRLATAVSGSNPAK